MKFPRKQIFLFSIRAEFINFEGLITMAKKHRLFKRALYITIDFVDSFIFFYLKNGALIDIYSLQGNNVKKVNLNEVFEKMKRGDTSIVNAVFTEQELIEMIVASFFIENLLDKYLLENTDKFLERIKENKFTGFIKVSLKDENSYISFENGAIKNSFIYPNIRDNNEVINFLKKHEGSAEIYVYKLTEKTELMESEKVKMLIDITNKVITVFQLSLGRAVVTKFTQWAINATAAEYDFFKKFNVDSNGTIVGNNAIDAEPDSIIRSFAMFINIFYDSIGPFAGGKAKALLKDALNDFRYALDDLKFFSYMKVKIFE